MLRIGSLVRHAFVVAFALFLVSCASAPPPPPPITKVQGSVQATAGINPDVSGRPSPVVVRLYELRAPGAFQGADFFAIYDREAATLGQDVVVREELQLQPGETRELNRELRDDTRHVGVIAAFRDIDQARWRAVVPVPKGVSTSLIIKIDTLSVSIETAPK